MGQTREAGFRVEMMNITEQPYATSISLVHSLKLFIESISERFAASVMNYCNVVMHTNAVYANAVLQMQYMQMH